MGKFRLIIIASTAALLVLFIVCQRTTSPYLDNYEGEYVLDAEWSAPRDTFFTLQPYFIDYESIGRDTFQTYSISTDPSGFIDASFFGQTMNDSQMTIIFTGAFNGSVVVTGVHPNSEETSVGLPVTVINPFAVEGAGDYSSGETVSLSISATDSLPLTARWFVDSIFAEEQSADGQFILKSDTVVSHSVFAVISDTLGHSVSTDTVTVAFQPSPPSVEFLQRTLDVPLGVETTLSVQSSNCDSIRWFVKGPGLSVTTTGTLKATFSNAGPDTVIATGINRYGTASSPDTLFVTVMTFTYSLNIEQFPDTIRARRWNSWKVQVTENGVPLTGPEVTYHWKMTPDSIWDSLATTGGGRELELYIGDSIPPFTLSVMGKIGGGDSTWRHQQRIVVRAFRPSCSFVTTDFNVPINQQVTLTIKAEDSNSDGGIAGVYYLSSDNQNPVSTNGELSWTMKFLTPGQKEIKCYVVDNEGFISDTATLGATVTASKPYFERPVLDTMVFINDSLTIVVNGLPGNTGDSIVGYHWDFGGDGVWDTATTNGTITIVYSASGIDTIKAGCRNQRGDSAETPAIISIVIDEGAPEINTVDATPVITWAGGEITLAVTASDTNGLINRIAVRINDLTDSIITVSPSAHINTAFSFTLSDPGKYLFAAAAIDDDNVKSPYVSIGDSVVVTKGEPVIHSFSPDSVWIMDSVGYTLSATDVNGTVAAYYVKWDDGLSFVEYADSIIEHAYATGGLKHLSFYVVDNDNISSDTLSDSVYVKPGKPLATLITPDSVWINDNVNYTLSASDPNDSIAQWAISWDTGLPYEMSADSIIAHSFGDPGPKNVKYFVVDNDGISSDTVSWEIYVKPGIPRVTSIRVSKPLDGIYIRDSLDFIFKGSDENDYIDSILISWGGDQPFDIRRKAIGDSIVCTDFQFARADSGARSILVRVKDPDGMTKDSSFAVTVLSGAPSVDSIKPVNDIWVRDITNYTIFAGDPNGTIDSIEVDWDN
ncbi:MAG: hypothetical protein GF401_14705, partial [Chitinivibrionales bacterium]|nr:hypothetical protein [Chitinivibrionales bacterium]